MLHPAALPPTATHVLPALILPYQALAARIRPPTLPAHELLYKTAEEQAAKREEARRAAEEAKLKVGSRTGVGHRGGIPSRMMAGQGGEGTRREAHRGCGRAKRASSLCHPTLLLPSPTAPPYTSRCTQECLFHPVMVTQPKGKEGRALRVKAELTQVDTAVSRVGGPGSSSPGSPWVSTCSAWQLHVCWLLTPVPRVSPCLPFCLQPKHTSHAGQAPPAAGIPEDTQLAAAAADLPAPILASFVEPASDQVHFDALERQINAALVRLSLSEEQMAASLRQASAEAAADAAPMAAPVAEACMQGEPAVQLLGDRAHVEAAAPVHKGLAHGIRMGGGWVVGGWLGGGGGGIHCWMQSAHSRLPCCLAPAVPVAQSVDANGYSLDWRAICGTPTPDGGAMPGAQWADNHRIKVHRGKTCAARPAAWVALLQSSHTPTHMASA